MQFARPDNSGSFHPSFEDPIHLEWKLPLVLSIVIHLSVFLAMVANLSLFQRSKPLDTYTVTLFNVEDTRPPAPGPPKAEAARQEAPPAAPKAEPQQQQPVPVPTLKPAELPVKPPVPVPVTPPREVAIPREVISIEPAKAKVKKEPEKIKKEIIEDRIKNLEDKVKKETINDKLKNSLQRLNTKVAEEKAQHEADRQVNKALDMVRSTLQITKPAAGPPAATTGEAGGGGGIRGDGTGRAGREISEAKRRYYAELMTHIQRFYKLPEMQQWDPNLEAHVVILIGKDGVLQKNTFEKKSDNQLYDKFVRQTLENASPLPPIPETLGVTELEIMFRFKPGELF